MTYKIEFEDGEFEIELGTDEDIFDTACKYENEHGIVFNIFEINEDDEEIRTVF
jgi:hypothetical protein